jgi:GNAT superfamily N-acetyltransferase
MTAGPQRYALRCVRSPQEWAAYHAIRRQAIFAALLPGQAYDETDPDEVAPGNFPHVLLHDGEIVGVVRIDLIGSSRARLRLLGIRSDLQRQGHGRVLLRLAQDAARRLGKTPIIINAHPTSLAVYHANGYRQGAWGTPNRFQRLSFAWGSDCGDEGIAPFPDGRARVPHPWRCRHSCLKSSPIPAIKGSLNCLPLLFR